LFGLPRKFYDCRYFHESLENARSGERLYLDLDCDFDHMSVTIKRQPLLQDQQRQQQHPMKIAAKEEGTEEEDEEDSTATTMWKEFNKMMSTCHWGHIYLDMPEKKMEKNEEE
jgi:hypothetical protein